MNATAFNWTLIEIYLKALSNRLAFGPDFAKTGLTGYSTNPRKVDLQGQSFTNLEVFFVNGAKIPTGGTVTWNLGISNWIDTVIINVNGTNINIDSAMTTFMPFAGKVVWNFYEATKITLNGQFQGAILAPYADVTTIGGQIDGQIFVKSWSGPMEVHFVKFTGCLPFISNIPGIPALCF